MNRRKPLDAQRLVARLRESEVKAYSRVMLERVRRVKLLSSCAIDDEWLTVAMARSTAHG